MTLYRAMFAATATRTIRFSRKFDRFAQLSVLAPWHELSASMKVLQHNGEF